MNQRGWKDAPAEILQSICRFVRIQTPDPHGPSISTNPGRHEDPCDSADPRKLWLYRSRRLERDLDHDLSDGRADIASVAQVCSRWNEIATEILYKEIDCRNFYRRIRWSFPIVTDSESEDEEPCDTSYDQKPMSRKLATTLSTSHNLGRFVRRIVLATNDNDIDTTLDHMKILRFCPLVEDVKIYGYYYDLIKPYIRVLTSLSHLRTLHINRFSIRGFDSCTFVPDDVDIEEWCKWLDGWPKLEKLHIPAPEYSADVVRVGQERGCYIEIDPEEV